MVSSMRRVAAISAGPRSASPRGSLALSLLLFSGLLGLSAISVYIGEGQGGSSRSAQRQGSGHRRGHGVVMSSAQTAALAQAASSAHSARATLVPNDLEAYWLPFTPNRAFKAAPRLFARAKDMHY